MKRINPSFLFPFSVLILLIFGFSTAMFNLPPIGKFMNPFRGFIQNGSDLDLDNLERNIIGTGINKTTTVYFDERKVPHIYADNEEDLYFAQGYVTASLRLWQMDFMGYVASGRLSEIFTEDAYLNYDRSQRRLGLLMAAKKSLALIEKDPATLMALSNYTKGVNAYINELNYTKLPLEYKLLDYEPEQWSNLKSVILLKYLGDNLSGYEEDLSKTNLILALGSDKFNKVFPRTNGHTTPVMQELVGELNPSLKEIIQPDYLNYSFISSKTAYKSNYNPQLGSNSWVVDGQKTTSGFPILCNDPHLTLSLPSIWVEMQLNCPDMNVYGVSIPGTPSIIIGYNEDIAWGITNGADDVKDWYKMKISEDYSTYQLDGKWIKLNRHFETIYRKGKKPYIDTIYSSVQGPIMFDKSFPNINEGLENHALRWELLKPSNEFLTFLKLNKSKNYSDYIDAIQHYKCPSQNFTFACKDNTISINHQGNIPVRWEGQGMFILDGSKSSHLYKKYIPIDSLPASKNPSSHYLLSANQHPTTENYPYTYYGYFFETRANRINKLLKNEQRFDPLKMQQLQTDNTNDFASKALPELLNLLSNEALDAKQSRLIKRLKKWSFNYDLSDQSALFFELWWKNTETLTWDEISNYSFYSVLPENYVLLDLLKKEPENIYFDRLNTSKTEQAKVIVRQAFFKAYKEYIQKEHHAGIAWGNNNQLSISHPTGETAFSVTELKSSGHPSAINARAASWGPSWRMIVELGDRPRGYGIYAGGQSGNIGSKYYDNFIAPWNDGTYYSLNFYMTKDEAKKQSKSQWILK